MYECPSCSSRGVRLVVKWWGSDVAPGKCHSCGALVAPLPQSKGEAVIAAALTLTAGGFGAVAAQAVWIFWCSLAVSAIPLLWRWHFRPLYVLTPKQVAVARVIEGSLFAIFIATFLA